MWRYLSTAIPFALVLFSLSSFAQSKTRFPLLPTGVWVGSSSDGTEVVTAILQRALTQADTVRPKSELVMSWIDSRGPSLVDLSFKKSGYVPDGVLGVAMGFTAQRKGLLGSKNEQAPPDFYGIIDLRPNGTLRVCYFESKQPKEPKKLSLSNDATDGAICLDFERLNASGQCVRACIARDSARAVSAQMIESDCKRRCGGRFR